MKLPTSLTNLNMVWFDVCASCFRHHLHFGISQYIVKSVAGRVWLYCDGYVSPVCNGISQKLPALLLKCKHVVFQNQHFLWFVCLFVFFINTFMILHRSLQCSVFGISNTFKHWNRQTVWLVIIVNPVSAIVSDLSVLSIRRPVCEGKPCLFPTKYKSKLRKGKVLQNSLNITV